MLIRVPKSIDRSLIFIILLIVASFVLGGICGHEIGVPVSRSGDVDVRGSSGNYHFISPLLACKSESEIAISNHSAQRMHDDMQSYINQEINLSDAKSVSVFFRELDGGSSFGINENDAYDGGSLLKVPLVMSIYKYAESHPGFIDAKVKFGGGSYDTLQYYAPSKQIEPGKTYTVEQLTEAALVYSDNNAAILLSQIIPKQSLYDSYTELGISVPQDNQSYTISAKLYGSFFRVLYNATYLDHNDSEHMLALLAQADFTQGIVSGVASGTTVAHKFGERAQSDGSDPELHDCGITYDHHAPYLVCVMTKGSDFDTLSNVISHIASIAYKYENQ